MHPLQHVKCIHDHGHIANRKKSFGSLQCYIFAMGKHGPTTSVSGYILALMSEADRHIHRPVAVATSHQNHLDKELRQRGAEERTWNSDAMTECR